MMEALQIVAGSWPLAVMFIAFVGGCIAMRIISALRQADRDDKAYKSSSAVAVMPRARHDD